LGWFLDSFLKKTNPVDMDQCTGLRQITEKTPISFSGFGIIPLFFFLFLSAPYRLTSQVDPDLLQCGTILPTGAALDSLYNQHQRFLATQSPGSPIPALGDRLVPVKFHIIRDDGCSGGVPEMDLLNELNTYVNPRYAGAGLFFVACDTASIICSSEFTILEDYAEGDAMSMMYNVPNVLNIYVVEDPDELCGWARFSSHSTDYVVLANNCATNTSTMAHEIGHYFDLFHTHETAWGAELVDGSNCMTAGDLICDTPADPVLFDSSTDTYKVDAMCVYSGNDLDANGQPYMPDATNLMSYSRKDCRDNFSQLQLAKAAFIAATERNYVNVITCPPGTIEYVDANCELIMPDYRDLITFNAPCEVEDTIQTPAPGTVITDLGFTMVTITVTTMGGEMATCDFYMTVRDTIKPEFTPVDPDTILTNLQCEGVLPDYRDSTMVTDNCDPNPIITQEPPPGTDIGGVGTVQTVYVIAEDESGNIDSLPIQVMVIDASPESQLNCRDLNLSLDVAGLAEFQLAELVQGANCSELHTLRIETSAGALVFQDFGLIRSSYISFLACRYRGQQLKATVTNESGASCWGYLTFKQGNGPIVQGRSFVLWCYDTLLTDISKYFTAYGYPSAYVPCVGPVPVKFVADWIEPYDCVPGVQDTAKIIYREYETFDKQGVRATAFDTIVVFRLPQLHAESFFCPGNQTIYCSDTTDFVSPAILFSYDAFSGFLELIEISRGEEGLEFYPAILDPKCGLQVHVDYWQYGDARCNAEYKIAIEVKQTCPGSLSDLAVSILSPNAFVALDADSTYWRCEFWLTDLDTLPPVIECKDDNLLLTTVYTTAHECAAHTYIPPVYVHDAWTGVKQVKATIEGIGAAILSYNEATKCYESHMQFKLPYQELPYRVIYEAYDSCHNLAREYCYIRVKDRTRPVAVSDKGVTVSLSDKKVWVDAATFDEGSWDNCGVNLLLARRSDWYEACVELCDSLVNCWVSEHHDTLWQPWLQPDKHLDPVEAHYRKTLDWLWNDNVACGDLMYNAWQYDLMKHAYLNCVEHPYEVGSEDFYGLFREAIKDPDFASKWKNPSTLFVGTSRFGLSGNHSYYVQMNGNATPVFDSLGVWGATTDFANNRILFTSSFGGFENEGNILYALPFGGIEPIRLGRIKNIGGNDSIRIDGLALSHGVLYGSQQIDYKNSRGIYKIDLTTLEAELVLFIEGNALTMNSGIGGIDADPITGKIYGADEINNRIVEIDLSQSMIKKIADFPAGVTKVQGVAVGGGKIYLVPSVTGSLHVFDLATSSYEQTIVSPFSINENFSGGAAYMPMLEDLVDEWSQIGGGWSDAVPFSCDDACSPVTVEILVMDYWCNWSTAWTKVWVEDKTPVKVVKDVSEQEAITCKVYKENNYSYPGEDHPVSLEYIVEQAKVGTPEALDALDGIFGGYQKAWVDPYGHYVDSNGQEIEGSIPFYDSICDCKKEWKQVRVYDEHLGYLWVDSLVTECYYEADTLEFWNGIVAVNCAENVYCEQEVWCEFDHCGQGYIFRKFKIWSSCAEATADSAGHIPDTIYRHQRIWVGNECELSKYMFDRPYDTEVYTCNIEYGADGNVIGDAGPENTGYPVYQFDDDCRIVGIAHEDKVFKIVGGDAACYKILRTWYFADWCGYGGDRPVGRWWLDDGLVIDRYVQQIIVIDTVGPRCVLTGPVQTGDTVETGACEYELVVTVDASDACGLTSYYWELKDFSDPDDALFIDSGNGSLAGEEETAFDIVVAGLAPGTYKLLVTLRDECNNESYCEYTVVIQAGKKPTPVCISSLTARLTPWDSDNDGEIDTAHAVVWAYEFDRSSTPACGDDSLEYRIEFVDDMEDETPAGDLDYLDLGCAHIGTRLVRMWVISHPSLTSDYCDVVLVVQSDFTGCVPTAGGGDVMTYEENMTHPANRPTLDRMSGDPDGLHIAGDAGLPAGWSVPGFTLEQNHPNPFRYETVIGFTLPEAMPARLRIFDVTGRLLKTLEGDFPKGYSRVTVDRDDLRSTGVLYYQLETKDYLATRKMVLLE
jgi:hypothetical protein